MNSKLIVALMAITFALGMWNCQDTAPSNAGPVAGRAKIQGSVLDLNTSLAVQNATLFLSYSGKLDSAATGTDGSFVFPVIDLNTVQDRNATLSVRKAGYEAGSFTFVLSADTSFAIYLRVDLSTSALIVGTLRDSSTLYPLRNAALLLTLPGVVDSAVTPVDGSFRLTADLIDRDSLPVSLTAFKGGYKTRALSIVVYKGQTTNLGNVLMNIDAASTIAQVMGHVFDSQGHLPLINAKVIMLTNIVTDSVQTSVAGDYSFTVDLKGLPSVSGILKFSKGGYTPQAYSFTVGAGKSGTLDVSLNRDTTTGIRDTNGTGSAHSIAFIGLTANQISVYGVGGTEATILTWEVRDSLGFPIDYDHRDTVDFSLTGVPVNGPDSTKAYVSPSRAITNASGRVSTTVNSGTVSGVLQFTATMRRNSDGYVIRSTPVIITVNAGLPEQGHFTIGADLYNFAAYDWLGRSDRVTVLVGDRYTNPVKPQTAVYFNTTGGVIEASGFTSLAGFASVNLYSGNPTPRDSTLTPPSLYGNGTGYAHVASHTLGEGGAEVLDTILVLFSARSVVTVPPVYVHIDSGSFATVAVKIADRFGNPLSSGTQITVTAIFSPPQGTNWSVQATGLPVDPLDDYIIRGPGVTDYTLRIQDGTPGGTPFRMPFTIKISVTGPNGNAYGEVNGDVGP